MATRNRSAERGTTLIELAIVMGVSAVLVGLILQAMISFDHSRVPRQLVANVQGAGRLGLTILARDIQASAVAAPTGIVWADLGGKTTRPAVQIFNDIQGGGSIDQINGGRYKAKRGTDALLVIRAQTTEIGPGATLVGDHYQTQTLNVSTISGFSDGTTVLFGQYGDAGWGTINGPPTGAQINLKSNVNLFLGQSATMLPSGSAVRPAVARLYYVDSSDELVQMMLPVPRAPVSAAETGSIEVVAQGIENFQLDCQVDNGTALAACPAAVTTTDPLSAESANAFGSFAAGQGPRITAANVSTLRTVALSVLVRSVMPVADAQQGDPKVTLDGNTLPVGIASPTDSDTAYYVRRTYLLQLAVRNLGLGVL